MHGIVVVDKPSGMTSAAVVARVKRALGVKKVGHTGTLDPMATGVLPLCIGEGTKVAGYLLAEDKIYEGEFLLGVETDTLDREGKILKESPSAAAGIEEEDVEKALELQRGSIEQIPPMFSALKHKGKRLHALAREGKVVDRAPRSIEVRRLELRSFGDGRGRFYVEASKGCYVRSIVRDLGEALGCGAHLTELRRIQSGKFGLDEAISLEKIEKNPTQVSWVDPAKAVSHLESLLVPQEAVAAVADGKRLEWQLVSGEPAPDGKIALLGGEGQGGEPGLLAIAEIDQDRLRYHRVFNYALTQRS